MAAGSRGKAETDGAAGRATPGAHLRAELRRLGLDQVAVSKATGVSRQSVNNIINGRQAISRAMAGKLGRLTGRSSDYWLGESFGNAPPGLSASGTLSHGSGVGLLVNHQILQAVKDGIIGIEPFAIQYLKAASIDLTLSNFLTGADGEKIDIGRGKDFVLEPGKSVNATAIEQIDLPRDYLGRIGAATRLCSIGIIASCAFQIEPGFKGLLRFQLFNASGSPFRLRAADPVIGLEIFRLAATPDTLNST